MTDEIKIPKNQKLWVSERDIDGKLIYVVISNKTETTYYLYKVGKNNELKKVETNSIPVFKHKITDKEKGIE